MLCEEVANKQYTMKGDQAEDGECVSIYHHCKCTVQQDTHETKSGKKFFKHFPKQDISICFPLL